MITVTSSKRFPALLSLAIANSIGLPATDARCLKRGKVTCSSEAKYIRIWMPLREGRPPICPRPISLLCLSHAVKTAQRDSIPLLDSVVTYLKFQENCIALFKEMLVREKAASERQHEQWTEERLKFERTQLEEHGRILRMSGMEGRMYELKDASLECELNDGTKVRVCCRFRGIHIIRHLHRGRVAVPEHTPDCEKNNTASEGAGLSHETL